MIASSSSLLILAFGDRLLLEIFYGRDVKPGDLKDYLNDAVGNYLSVIGLVYGLLVAQLLGMAHARKDSIRSALASELSGVHRILVLLREIKCEQEQDEGRTLVLRSKAVEVLRDFVVVMEEVW